MRKVLHVGTPPQLRLACPITALMHASANDDSVVTWSKEVFAPSQIGDMFAFADIQQHLHCFPSF